VRFSKFLCEAIFSSSISFLRIALTMAAGNLLKLDFKIKSSIPSLRHSSANSSLKYSRHKDERHIHVLLFQHAKGLHSIKHGKRIIRKDNIRAKVSDSLRN